MSERVSERGQVSLSIVEAIVGLVVVLAATTTFLVGLPETGADEADLNRLADDGLTALDSTPPAGDGASRLTALARGPGSFAVERSDADEQLRELYPRRVRYRLETPHGTIGEPLPPTRTTGLARRYTPEGDVTFWVWLR
ncbi:DUF7262 family protein [Salinigranum sp. GCM10025319]|uniref:DUF7262 family protein n=1 Tax=Salinigranum sp. GCM10025319 TaxID=3252687 RepID=UPI0036106A7D